MYLCKGLMCVNVSTQNKSRQQKFHDAQRARVISMLACTQALLLGNSIQVGVSEGKEEALISLAHPNPLAFDRAQISSKTLARGKFGD